MNPLDHALASKKEKENAIEKIGGRLLKAKKEMPTKVGD